TPGRAGIAQLGQSQVIEPGPQPRKGVHRRFAQAFRPALREGAASDLHVLDDQLIGAERGKKSAIGGRRFTQQLEIAPDGVVDLIASHVLEIDSDLGTSDIDSESGARYAPRPRVRR